MSAASLREILPLIPKDHNLANVVMTVLYTKRKKNMRYLPITFRPRQGGENSINLRKITKIGLKAVKDFGDIRGSLNGKN